MIVAVGDMLSATVQIAVRAVTPSFYYTATANPTVPPAACNGPPRFDFCRPSMASTSLALPSAPVTTERKIWAQFGTARSGPRTPEPCRPQHVGPTGLGRPVATYSRANLGRVPRTQKTLLPPASESGSVIRPRRTSLRTLRRRNRTQNLSCCSCWTASERLPTRRYHTSTGRLPDVVFVLPSRCSRTADASCGSDLRTSAACRSGPKYIRKTDRGRSPPLPICWGVRARNRHACGSTCEGRALGIIIQEVQHRLVAVKCVGGESSVIRITAHDSHCRHRSGRLTAENGGTLKRL